MSLEPEAARKTRDCKLKAVNPPVRSVSTPRGRKDLPERGRVNPASAAQAPRRQLGTSDWDARRLAKRLRRELNRFAWSRLSAVASEHGRSVEGLRERGLSETR
jgi:hypothetical protein